MDNQQQEQARKSFIQKRQQQAEDVAKDQAKKKIQQAGLRGGKAGTRITAQAMKQLAMQGVRMAAAAAAQAASAAAAAASTAASAVGAPVALIVIIAVIILLLLVSIIAAIFGGIEQSPECDGINVKLTTPFALSAVNCKFGSNALIYRWTTTGSGTFSSPSSQNTTYTPVPTDIGNITITLVVCDSVDRTNCSDEYSADITVTADNIPADPPPTGGATPTCDSGDYQACLLSQFGVRVIGFPASQDKIIYNSLALGFRYSNFLRLFKRANPQIVSGGSYKCPSGTWCAGAWATAGGGKITVYGVVWDQGFAYQSYLFVHEAAHIAGGENYSLQSTLYNNAYVNRKDYDCYTHTSNRYTNAIEKTYPVNLLIGMDSSTGRKIRESWAESVNDTILCKSGGWCPSRGGGGSRIWDFPTNCKYIHDYVVNALD